MRPPVTKEESTQTVQCEANGGETSQMWQEKAVPRPFNNMYFGVKAKRMPRRRFRPKVGAVVEGCECEFTATLKYKRQRIGR